MKVLLIEDDEALRPTLERALRHAGMQVASCADGNRALERWRAGVPDVVLLDLTLPGLDGLEILRRARAEGMAAPVLILTARGTVGDRVLGLNLGADDYLAKPFDLDEVEARVRALARRTAGGAAEGLATALGHLRVEPSGAVSSAGTPMELSPRESALLKALLAQGGKAVAKERLFEQVFSDATDAQPQALEVVAYRLRRKLGGSGTELVTLRGLGYLLRSLS
ncbi:MAG: response regulator [Aquabacterium sp.]